MKRNDIKILVVEDDDSLGRATTEALKRVGYDARWVNNPDEALVLIRQTEYKLVVIDCLLPRTNGVDLAEKLCSIAGDDLKVIFTSGVYKDKSFTKEAVKKVNASAFLVKPYELEKLQSIVDDCFGDDLEGELPPLLNLLTLPQVHTNDRLNALAKIDSLHGYDLPIVYSLLFGSQISGQLNVISSDGDVSSLSFHKGQLTSVLLKDKTSYFGVLLVEMGFTSNDDVEQGLAVNSPQPLGERLVAAHSLSPHAIKIVREEQMLIRLSKTVQDAFVDVTFMPSDVDSSDVMIARERFNHLIWDWTASKISIDWFRLFYSRWLDYALVLIDEGQIRRRLSQVSPGTDFANLLAEFAPNRPLGEILDSGRNEESAVYSLLQFLLANHLAHFGQRRSSKEDAVKRIKRLKRALKETEGKNYYEVLNVSPKSGEREINKNYLELAKNYHPDRVEPSAPAEVRELTEKLFARISEAHEALKDIDRRQQYARELETGSAEKILQNEDLFEKGHSLLQKGKYAQALGVFSELSRQRHHRGDVNIFLAWAKLKVGAGDQRIENYLREINELLMKVPPEERHSAHYFYVKGVYYAQLGDLEKAKTNYKHAMVLDPSFVEARRDLAIVREHIRKSEGTQLGEFSTVVDMFFGRKKKS